MAETTVQRLTSRKFIVSIVAGILVTVGSRFGIELDVEQLGALILVVASYIFGEAQIDKARVRAEIDSQLNQVKLNATEIIRVLQEELKKYQDDDGDDLHEGYM